METPVFHNPRYIVEPKINDGRTGYYIVDRDYAKSHGDDELVMSYIKGTADAVCEKLNEQHVEFLKKKGIVLV